MANKTKAAARNPDLVNSLNVNSLNLAAKSVANSHRLIRTNRRFSRRALCGNSRSHGIRNVSELYKKHQENAGPDLEKQPIERALNLPRQPVGRNQIH